MRAHGTLAVRRGESDRDALRLMRETVRGNDLLGMFVEGTRQRAGVPGEAKPGAAMVAIQEGVPVVPAAVYGSLDWKWNCAPVSVAFGEPHALRRVPARTSAGYRQATAEIQDEIRAALGVPRARCTELGRPDAVPPHARAAASASKP